MKFDYDQGCYILDRGSPLTKSSTGISPKGFIFTRVEASGALSRDVSNNRSLDLEILPPSLPQWRHFWTAPVHLSTLSNPWHKEVSTRYCKTCMVQDPCLYNLLETISPVWRHLNPTLGSCPLCDFRIKPWVQVGGIYQCLWSWSVTSLPQAQHFSNHMY